MSFVFTIKDVIRSNGTPICKDTAANLIHKQNTDGIKKGVSVYKILRVMSTK